MHGFKSIIKMLVMEVLVLGLLADIQSDKGEVNPKLAGNYFLNLPTAKGEFFQAKPRKLP